MTEVFEIKEPHYNLRSRASQIYSLWDSVCGTFRTKNIAYSTPNIRESNSLNEFKSLTKSWKRDTCPCRLCANHIAKMGFISSYIHRNYLSFLFKSIFLVGVN